MGNEENKGVVEEMQGILGLTEEPIAEANTEGKTAETKIPAEVVKPTTTLVTQDQLSNNKEIIKIDLQIEALEKITVDAGVFYDNLESQLSEEEQQLEFSDKSAYMKLVAKKADEYVAKNSKSEEIMALQEQKKELELINERQSSIVEVSAKYPDYDHAKMLSFYQDELSKSQQDKILKASKSYADVFENTYKAHLALNPTKIHTTPAPNIPNVNNARKQSVNSADIDNGLTSHDDALKAALGL